MPVRGDTQTLTVTFYDVPGGSATDPTDVSLEFLLGGSSVYGPFSVPPIVRDAVGLFRYEWTIPLDADLGTYTAVWSGILPGDPAASIGYETVEVTSGVVLDPALPDFCWPVNTAVCATEYDAWAVEPVAADPDADPPVEAVEGVPVYSAAVKAYAEAMAGQTMRLLTGFRVGGCPITVRPCRAGCDDPTYRSYPAQGASGSTPWYPVSLGGTWLNISCGLHLGACGCTGVEAIRLSSIVGAITEVKIDGAVLDPSAYRLDGGGILTRVDGEPWPLCQHIDAPDTEEGTWSVSYTPGEVVDGIGAIAAGLLALEYAKACSSQGQCNLPAGVQSIARGGVQMTLASDVFPNGRTGIVAVDTYLERWNPHGLRSRPVVWSPDRHMPRGLRG